MGSEQFTSDDAAPAQVVERVCRLLQRVRRWKWRNTEGLARELGIDCDTLYEALRTHAEHGEGSRRIRYHRYPSRRMDTLWGLVDVVGEEALPPLQRADAPPSERRRERDPSRPLVFVSYNHRDTEGARRVAAELTAAAAEPWLYETDLRKDEHIVQGVGDCIDCCQGLLVYVSGNSIDSLWVHKEFGRALDEYDTAILVFIDGDDPALLESLLGKHSSVDRVRSLAESRAGNATASEKREIVRRAGSFGAEILRFIGEVHGAEPPTRAERSRQVSVGDLNEVRAWARGLCPPA